MQLLLMAALAAGNPTGQTNEMDACLAMARVGKVIARNRDNGTSAATARSVAITSLDESYTMPASPTRDAKQYVAYTVLTFVPIVYSPEYLSWTPDEVYAEIFTKCIEN